MKKSRIIEIIKEEIQSSATLEFMKRLTKDETLRFDDYDMNDRPLFVSDEDEDMEYTIDENGWVWSHDGFHDKAIGKLEDQNLKENDDPFTKFPNLRRREGNEEIARTILNNGFFTIAHNIPSSEDQNWNNFFKELGASESFLNELEDMFSYKHDHESGENYDNFDSLAGQGDYDEDDPYAGPDIIEDPWECMVEAATALGRMAEREGLTQKLIKIAKW
jgi:hypothetical protein